MDREEEIKSRFIGLRFIAGHGRFCYGREFASEFLPVQNDENRLHLRILIKDGYNPFALLQILANWEITINITKDANTQEYKLTTNEKGWATLDGVLPEYECQVTDAVKKY